MSIISAFFRSKFRMIGCPFCQTELLVPVDRKTGLLETVGQRCTNPKCRELPANFLIHCEEAASVHIPMMGWTSAGKSTFLVRLSFMLSQAHKIWTGYERQPLTPETLRFIQTAKAEFESSVLPGKTNLEVQETYLLYLKNMGPWGSRMWIMRDVPGEHFEKFEIPDEQAPFVVGARTVFLFLDLFANRSSGKPLSDKDRKGMTIEQLLQCYTSSLTSRGHRFNGSSGRNVIVILSKASQVVDLPDELRNYVDKDTTFDDPLTEQRMDAYMAELERISGITRNWLEKQPDGKAFLNHAESHHLNLKFCLISAIPSGVLPGTHTPVANSLPKRILDPVFWALHLTR